MALTRYLQPTPAQQRPPGVTCEDYVRGEDTRCLHYRPRGVCVLASGGVCTEWLKVNRQGRLPSVVPTAPAPLPALSPVEPTQARVDLFGHPLAETGSKKLAQAPAAKLAPPTPTLVDVKEPNEPAAEAEPSILRGLTDEAIASFRALRTEVCFTSETYGEVWLVPDYTGQARKELTPEHAATLVRVLSAFPGSRVTSFERAAPPRDGVVP
ncbi:hypothetical protein DRW03_35295 [Corallococcus sp. H22C18031201]|nr:hypothetical protein DRW03_35295 [Corallococcus sp. H22C18031201]